MNRAYSVLEVKDLDDDKRILTGLATTPSTDRMDDIVEPKGAVFKLPLPLLWQHRHDQPIGNVTRATVKDSGIEVVAQIAKIAEPGVLKDRIDEAWQSITRWEWLELSAVTVPANAEATIQAIKSMDEEIRKGRGIPLIKARAGSLSRGAVELIRR
jgi:hypothetical protein